MKTEGYKFPVFKESDAMFSADTAPSWKDGDRCHRCRTMFTLIYRKVRELIPLSQLFMISIYFMTMQKFLRVIFFFFDFHSIIVAHAEKFSVSSVHHIVLLCQNLESKNKFAFAILVWKNVSKYIYSSSVTVRFIYFGV